MSQGFGTPPPSAQSGSADQVTVSPAVAGATNAQDALEAILAAQDDIVAAGLPAGGAWPIISDTQPAEGDFAWLWYKPVGGSLVLQSGYVPDVDTAPTFTVDPAITGTALVGSTLTCDGGTATGTTPITKTYQWTRDGTNIPGATASTRVLVSGDVGHAIRCVVTATNGISPDDTATSNAITPAVPVNTIAPAITGSAVTGQVLTRSTGTWTSAGSPSYTQTWQRDGADISGATASTYTLQVADEGHVIRCRVTATDANGAGTPANSNTVTPSASATAPGQVTGLGATAGDTQVALAWTAPASDGGSAITTYLVEYRTPAGSGSYTTFSHSASTTPSITVTGLTNSSQYEFRVSAVNAIGTGTASSTATATPVASGGGAVFVNDTFTGTDSVDVDARAGETGATWTVVSGGAYAATAKIFSNAARVQADYAMLYASGTPATADYDVAATLYVNALTGNLVGVVGRKTRDNVITCYELRYVVGTGLALNKIVASSFSSLATHAMTAVTGDVIKLQMRGTTIKGFLNGAEVMSVTDSAISAAGAAGITGGASGVDIDSFTATDA